MRLILVGLFAVCLASIAAAKPSLQDKLKNLVPASSYKSNFVFIQRLFKNEKAFYNGNSIDIAKVLSTLRANGLLNLKLDKPSNVVLSFKIKESKDAKLSPLFLAYTTSSLLSSMGYSYFYVTQAQKMQGNLSLSYTLNAEAAVDPTVIVSSLSDRGYRILDVSREGATGWVYDLVLERPNLANMSKLVEGELNLNHISGKYWVLAQARGELKITPSEATIWNPKILIFDSSMNLIDSVLSNEKKKSYLLEINQEPCFVLITDNYTPANLRNGLVITFKPYKD